MTQSSDARQEIEALRERISTLSAAILSISATLDLDTVLVEVVESARRLTGARYGVIATVDETGALTREFVFSGFTPEEEQELATWPDRGRLFNHLHHLPGPLRLADLAGYVRSLGITPARMFSRSFQGTPMRHRRRREGSGELGARDQTGALVGSQGKERMEAPRTIRLREIVAPRRGLSYGLLAEPLQVAEGINGVSPHFSPEFAKER